MLWPSLINVLRRDMSLVGPRPISPDEVVSYGPWSANLLALRPGLTGPWWVGGDTKIALEQLGQSVAHECHETLRSHDRSASAAAV